MEKTKATYFGYDTLSAADNMAIDELLEEKAGATGNLYLRFYDTPKNAIVLSISDHMKVIARDTSDAELSRRISGGKPIFLGKGTLSYSIEGPLSVLGSKQTRFGNPNAIHQMLGPHLAEALRRVAGLSSDRLTLGEVYSINIDGKPVAGHAQHINASSFIYHGVMAIEKWDAEYISERLRLREGDYEKLDSLPYIKQFVNGSTESLKQNIIDSMKQTFEIVPMNQAERSEIMQRSEKLAAEKYSSSGWVMRTDDGMKENSTFCLLYTG
ncbi:MAG: lipoate--protein ligase family protein [Candidatus Micrarchaeia archaeon]